MSNTLNKIHYAAVIKTSSDKSSPSIGLYNGKFCYTTDGYAPSDSDTWDADYDEEHGQPSAKPSDFTWNTDLMSKQGVQGIGSKIDIIAGGDYSFLQNVSVKLVNKTNLGHTIHKTIADLTDVSVIGAEMHVYVIIEGVWYPRWYGIVAAKAFSDTTFVFTGADKLSNSTDTLNSVVLGLIDADVEYKPLGDLIIENLIAFRFHYVSELNSVNHIKVNSSNCDFAVDDRQFTGVALGTEAILRDVNDIQSIEYTGDLDTDAPVAGDVLKFETNNKLYAIKSVTEVHRPGTPDSVRLEIEELDDSTDYTFLFDDSNDQFWGTVHEGLETIGKSDTKCYFSLYKSANDTGIDPSMLDGSGTLRVINDDISYTFKYMVNSEGGIVVTTPKANAIIKPTRVRMIATDEDGIFDSNTGRDWEKFSELLEGAEDMYFANDMDPEGAFELIEADKKHVYFYCEFDKSEIENHEELNIGFMLKGYYEGEGSVVWNARDIHIGDYWWYRESTNTYGLPVPDIHFQDAKELARTCNEEFAITYYSIIENNKYGPIPLSESDMRVPNQIDNGVVVKGHYDTSGQYPGTYYMYYPNSVPVTPLPMYTQNVLSLNNNIFVYRKQHTLLQSSPYYPKGTYDTLNKTFEDADKVGILIKIAPLTEDERDHPDKKVAQHVSDTGVQTFTSLKDVDKLTCRINGFCLYSTKEFTSETSIKVQSSEPHDDYYTLVEEVSNNNGDYTLIDGSRKSWKAGLQVKEQQQRYGVITKLMKQGFCTGFTNRFGIDSYKTFPERQSSAPIVIDDSVMISGSIKDFKSTPIAKVYNEFKLEGSFETVEIKNVTENEFPLYGDDYSEYVVGIEPYDKAKYYWEKAHDAYKVTGAIHKAPSDRTKLEFAYSSKKPAYFSTESEVSTISALAYGHDIRPGDYFGAVWDVLHPYVEVGDVVQFVSTDGLSFIEGRIVYNDDPDLIAIALDTNVSEEFFDYDLINSWARYETDDTYRDEYLDKLLDWTTFPKLQVRFSLALTPDTVKYEIMDEIKFSDPIITPDLGEYGEGWITSLQLDTGKNIINCEATFVPEFYIIPASMDKNSIIEDASNTDTIVEDASNTDYIVEGA